ncbi:retrovirus-related pol polyprotein from transposon TNT 1-94 [Tanacetum coccineum]
MSKVLHEREFGSSPSSTEANPRDQVKSISTTVEADTNSIRYMRSSQYAVSTPQNNTLMYETRQTTILFPSHLNDYYCEEKKGSYGPQFSKSYSYGASHIDNSIPRKDKDLRSFTLPCYINNVYFDNALVDLGASVGVMPLSTYLNLGLGELTHTKLTVKLVYRTVKYPKGIAENVLVGIGKSIFPVDFIILDMVRDEKIIFKSVKPASSLIKRVYMLSLRERMELDLEARLMGETLVLKRSMDPLYGDYIELNNLNIPLELRRNKVDDLMPTIEEGEVIEEVKARNDARMVSKNFGYPSDYDQSEKILVENINPYIDEGIGELVAGKPFCDVSCVETKRFDGINTIHGNDESVTYQMVRSHPRFKRHTNIQCNKIPPLLKVSEEDKMNRISHSYQKLKRFYKGVLNLGPNFIQDPTMEEWLTRGHVSVHEMKE